jgi:hypothetical protein
MMAKNLVESDERRSRRSGATLRERRSIKRKSLPVFPRRRDRARRVGAIRSHACAAETTPESDLVTIVGEVKPEIVSFVSFPESNENASSEIVDEISDLRTERQRSRF